MHMHMCNASHESMRRWRPYGVRTVCVHKRARDATAFSLRMPEPKTGIFGPCGFGLLGIRPFARLRRSFWALVSAGGAVNAPLVG
jgi:hypothetical protein